MQRSKLRHQRDSHATRTRGRTRRVRDPEVQDLATLDDLVQTLHDLLDRRGVIPPVNVEDIDIVGLELEQRAFERVLERLFVVAGVVDLDAFVSPVILVKV